MTAATEPRVVVLMSTYNGARYLPEQLESILCQLPASGRLIIRDDGSSDDTLDVVHRQNDPRIILTTGNNLGFARSFLTLMRQAPFDADMYMLADQDDVWKHDKIERAWQGLCNTAGPALYCSGMDLVSEQLTFVGTAPRWPRPPSFNNAMTENIVTGCTTAFNRPLLELVVRCGDAKAIHFHDWWMYLVGCAFGTVVYDPHPTLLYRQHGTNQVGMGAGLGRYWVILRFLRRMSWVGIMERQLSLFRSTYGDRLDTTQRTALDRLLKPDGRISRLGLVMSPCRYRQTWLGEALLRALVLVDRRR